MSFIDICLLEPTSFHNLWLFYTILSLNPKGFTKLCGKSLSSISCNSIAVGKNIFEATEQKKH